MAAGVPAMARTPSKGAGGGAKPSVCLQAQMALATVCPQATPSDMDCALSVRASDASEAFTCVASAEGCIGFGYASARITYAASMAAARGEAPSGAFGGTWIGW